MDKRVAVRQIFRELGPTEALRCPGLKESTPCLRIAGVVSRRCACDWDDL